MATVRPSIRGWPGLGQKPEAEPFDWQSATNAVYDFRATVDEGLAAWRRLQNRGEIESGEQYQEIGNRAYNEINRATGSGSFEATRQVVRLLPTVRTWRTRALEAAGRGTSERGGILQQVFGGERARGVLPLAIAGVAVLWALKR